MVGSNKELSQDSVFSKEINQPDFPINYVLFIIENIGDVAVNELESTEAELFIKRLFVQSDYIQYADKFQIVRNDLKKVLYEASSFLYKNKIPCTIALILKPVKGLRDILISNTGTGGSYIINSQSVNKLNEDNSLEKPQLFTGKLKKEDTLLLCSESLSASLDRNFIQRLVQSSNGPEEVCKKILHTASGTGRKENISVAAFNGSGTKRIPEKKWISDKNLLLIIVPLFFLLIGFIIYYLSSGTNEKPLVSSPVKALESSKLPPVIMKDTVSQPTDINTQIPSGSSKLLKEEIEKAPENIVKKIKNINFIVNGSLVMISNWESVKQDVLYINWDNGITDKKRIHKYLNYTSIPSSVKVTFKDNSTKSYRVK